MDLRKTVQKAAEQAFKALGSLALDATFVHVKSSNYNASTGEVDKDIEPTSIRVIRSEYSKSETVWESFDRANKGEFKFLALADSVINPNLVDYIIVDEVEYEVVKFTSDPAVAMYEFHVKAKV
jgi:hypothetical protein